MEDIRINKYLSEKGICSRREADRLLKEGKILVNGKLAEPGLKVSQDCNIEILGENIRDKAEPDPVVLVFNKPRGIVCTEGHKDKAPNIIDYIGYESHIFPVGRLDKDSEGLILLTNIGELVNRINKKEYGHEKEYLVRCQRKLSQEMLDKLSKGMRIEVPVSKRDGKTIRKVFEYRDTLPCKVKKIDDYTFNIVLTQGFNRQIRRMCAALGNKVTELKRIRIMNISLGKLETGKYRRASEDELRNLFKQLDMKMPF
ncbi:MAG: pseudouridine synthase [Eubacteriales bacterium]|nr:pseudouridine synthase [Eubacteriales bacterium]